MLWQPNKENDGKLTYLQELSIMNDVWCYQEDIDDSLILAKSDWV